MNGRLEKENIMKRKIENRLIDVPSIIEDYYYSLIGSGKSFDTAYRYINHVISFVRFAFKDTCDEHFYLKVKPVHINKYIASMRTKEVNGRAKKTSDSIRSVTWSALNSFFQFLIPEYISENPVASTKRPKMKDNPKVTYLTPNEITKIMHNVDKNAQEKFKNRDLCILKLGFSTGLRISAIVQIDLDDVDLDHNQIRVTEKGDYDSYVMFGDNLKAQILAWMQDRDKYFSNCRSNALFVSQRGIRISDDSVGVMLKKYANGATDKHVTPHVMRHSCATILYEATGDIYLCAKQLNHKNVSTTQRYAELSMEKQKKAANILDNLI